MFFQLSNIKGAIFLKKNILVCVLCLNRNYNTKPRANPNSKRLTLKKYCSYCNKHTLHQETK